MENENSLKTFIKMKFIKEITPKQIKVKFIIKLFFSYKKKMNKRRGFRLFFIGQTSNSTITKERFYEIY